MWKRFCFLGLTILFNPLSGAIGTFDADALRRYHTNTCTDQEVQLLLKKGVFIQESYDEREKIAQDRAQGIYDDSRKYIRIWTTSACNASCYYCYEKGLPFVSMEEATADALIRFLDPMIKPHDMLYLEWFGGEPLLSQPIISYIMDPITVWTPHIPVIGGVAPSQRFWTTRPTRATWQDSAPQRSPK